MNHRCRFFVVGLTALVSLAQAQDASHPASEKDKVVKQTWNVPRARTDIRIFREFGPTTTRPPGAAQGVGGASPSHGPGSGGDEKEGG